MRRIRLCLLIDAVEADAGAERQVLTTAARLDPARFEVHLCCLEDGPRLRQEGMPYRAAAFEAERLYSPAGLYQLARFRRYLVRHRIDIVHAHMVKTAMFGVLAALRLPRAAVITSRLNMGYWYTPGYLRIFRWLNRHTTRIFANSEAAARCAIEAERLPPAKVDVVYQGVDVARYSRGDRAAATALGISDSATVVGMVANLRPIKDIPLFLRAARLIADRVPGAAFLIVGQGPEGGRLAALAAELGIRDRVYFSNGRGEVPDYLARMSVGCLSSFGEGLSNAILEYMAAGLPVVATDMGGNREAIVHGNTGYLVAERTPEAFAAPILELLGNESRRREMGRNALARCRERFSLEATIKQLEEYYGNLIRG